MGWFHGFKLHIVVNSADDLLSFALTKGNTDDREPVEGLCHNFSGNLYADKGYISRELFGKLYAGGIRLVTGILGWGESLIASYDIFFWDFFPFIII